MSSRSKIAGLLLAFVAISQLSGGANGVPAPAPAGKPKTPEEAAAAAYNKGLEHRTRAMKAETAAAKDTRAADRAKNEAKAREEYVNAFTAFTQATELSPASPQAWNGLGFAYRKLGDFANALDSYDRALKLAPNFPDAIEYRGEAYLGLNRVDEAKEAYLALFAIDRKQAELLMKAMTAWVATRKADPAGVDPTAVSALEQWIKERAAIAQRTQLMAHDAIYRSW
jgi:tetratricopeptide (TPR) repeat protein